MVSPLVIENLIVEYPSKDGFKRAVNGLSFELKEGEIFGLLGPNGAGKTSIISAATSLISDWKGRITIFDMPVGSRRAKKLVGLVPQELISYGYFSVWEILHFVAGFYGMKKPRERIVWLLDRLQLTSVKDKKVAQLSGGMKRRLLIAKALLHSPKLLLLDEPSAGVDVELRQILWDFVRELNREGMAILLTTHYLEEAEELCDRIAILHNGKLLALDQTQKLTSSLESRVVFLKTKDEVVLRSTFDPKKIFEIKRVNGGIEVRVPGDMPLYYLLEELQIAQHQLVDVKTSEARLEDAFKKIIREDSYGR